LTLPQDFFAGRGTNFESAKERLLFGVSELPNINPLIAVDAEQKFFCVGVQLFSVCRIARLKVGAGC
jgi:hypothetical protein